MNRKIFQLFVMTVFIISSGFVSAFAQETSQFQNQPSDKIDALFMPWNRNDAAGVSVAIMKGDMVIYKRGFGLANIEHNIPIKPDTPFQIASITKQFTAFAALSLVADGKVALNDDIRKYIPELYENNNVITVSHLLDHMSGLRGPDVLRAMTGAMEDDVETRVRVLKIISQQKGLNFEPGTQYLYSNAGYFLLAQMIERVSGKPLADFFQDLIFTPLGMKDTYIDNDRSQIIKGRADSYGFNGKNHNNIILNYESEGSAGIQSTSLDLLKWAHNFTTRKVGHSAAFAMMKERSFASNGQPSIFGRGQEKRIYKGLETWSHGGRLAGFRTFLIRVPQTGYSISILSNRADFDTAKLAYEIIDIFHANDNNFKEEKKEEWSFADDKELASFAGAYELYPGTIFKISTEDQKLRFGSLFGDNSVPLTQVGLRRFTLNPESDIYFEFESGFPSPALYYVIGLHGKIDAARIKLDAFDKNNVNLNHYVGRYYSDEISTFYDLYMRDDTLWASHIQQSDFSFLAYQNDIFASQSGPLQKVEFLRNKDDEVTGFYASAPLVKKLYFKKLNP